MISSPFNLIYFFFLFSNWFFSIQMEKKSAEKLELKENFALSHFRLTVLCTIGGLFSLFLPLIPEVSSLGPFSRPKCIVFSSFLVSRLIKFYKMWNSFHIHWEKLYRIGRTILKIKFSVVCNNLGVCDLVVPQFWLEVLILSIMTC